MIRKVLKGVSLHTSFRSFAIVFVLISGTIIRAAAQQPNVGSRIYLFGVGINGPNTGSLSLLSGPGLSYDANGNGYVLTDSGGNFNIAGRIKCPSNYDPPVYLEAVGGSAGSGQPNPYLDLIAALPVACSQLDSVPSVDITEATTVAAAFALASFADSSDNGFSATPASTQTLVGAFAYANSLVSSYTGAVVSNSGSPAGTTDINTAADVLAACKNSADGSICQQLMAYTTIVGQSAPTDTWRAALNMAVNPTNNTTKLFGLVNSQAPYQPTYSSAPATLQLPTSGVPIITSLSSQTAGIGALLTINGSNFLSGGSVPTTVVVGGITTTAQTATQTLITTSIPVGASTGNVQVYIGSTGSNPVPLTIQLSATLIISLSPTVSTFGTPVTINVSVSSGGTTVPTGTVVCTAPTPSGLSSINIPLANGAGSGNVAGIPVGPQQSISCTYSGDSNFAAITTPVVVDEVVQQSAPVFQQPIASSRVYLFAVGMGGANTGSLSLLSGPGVSYDANGNGYVVTDGNGQFNLEGLIVCPSAYDPQVYLETSNGTVGGGNQNPYIRTLAALPVTCSHVDQLATVGITEATTAAAAFALASFADSSDDGFSTTPASAQNLASAFAYANTLANSYTGYPVANSNSPTVETDIDTVSDVLATCVNSPGGAVCPSLMSYATVNGQTIPTNTWRAMLSMAMNPTNNTANLNYLVNADAPYFPIYTAPPTTWQLPTTGVPVISSVSSETAGVGAPITIIGSNFLSGSSTPTGVVIGGITASVQSATATTITTSVPAGASSGSIQVYVGNTASNPMLFTKIAVPLQALTVVLNPTTSTFGQAVAVTVTTTSNTGVIPTGTVTCTAPAPSGVSSVSIPLTNGSGSGSVTGIPVGPQQPISCTYGGDGNFTASLTPVVAYEVVQQASTPPQQPIGNSRIYLFAVGMNGANTGPLSLLSGSGVSHDANGNGYIVSDSNGNFNLAGLIVCPSTYDPQVYLVNSGGSVGGGNPNPYIYSLAALPVTCSHLNQVQSVSVTEATTVAAAFALASFADSSDDGFSTTPASAQTLASAFAYANSLVNTATGNPILNTNSPTVETDIDTVADVLATCINSSGGSTCPPLMAYTTVNGQTAPVDTWKAALSMAVNAKNNTANLDSLVNAQAPYAPIYTTPPTTWQLPTSGVPVINSISSQAAGVGSSVSIVGTNFLSSGSDPTTVVIGGITANVVSATATTITTSVPAGASSGSIQVYIGIVGSNPVPFKVTAPLQSLTVALNPVSSLLGQPITVTVTAASGTAVTPTGTVTCTAPASSGTSSVTITLVNGVGSGSVTGIPAGPQQPISCIYNGDNNFAASLTPVTEDEAVSEGQPTLISLSSSPSAAAFYFGQPIVLTATLPASASGTVTFTDNGTSLPTPAPLTIAAGLATLTIKLPALGAHLFVATYSGDSTHQAGFSAALPLTVQQNPTTTKVTLSPITSWYGNSVIVNVTITAAGGTVVSAGGTVSCTAVPPTGSPINPAPVALSGTGTIAQVTLSGLPVTATGTSYSVTCAFTSNNTSEYSNSNSTAAPALGTVISTPNPTNSAVGSLLTPRAGHQATLISSDGTVLITGGTYEHVSTDNAPASPESFPALQSAEIYSGGGFASAAQMTTPRWRHTATALNNGTGAVLLTGGSNGSSALATAELFTPGNQPGLPGSFAQTTLYDSATGTFSGPISQMSAARFLHTATLLLNGEVLITGGQTSNGTILNTAELYNPLTGTFTLTGPMQYSRWMHTATLLSDGTVLIVGGSGFLGSSGTANLLDTAEIYTPSTNQFTPVGDMLTARSLAQATLLGNGTVLISGGATCTGGSGGYPDIRNTSCSTNEAEIYSAGTFTSTGSMSTARYLHTATVLYDGTVLIAGGLTNGENDTVGDHGNIPTGGDVSTEEIYNVQTGSFTSVSNLLAGRYEHTATLLPGTGVLFIGGETGQSVGYTPVGESDSDETVGPSAEVYGATGITGGLHPKYVVLDVMYAPPGSGSSMVYNGQSSIGSNSSTTNSFTNGLSLNTTFANFPTLGGGKSAGGGGGSGASNSLGGGYTYALSGTATYGLTGTTSDSTSVPGPNNSQLGVDHESDIVWVWLNPETDYTLPPPSSASGVLVWNGYSTNSDDPNVATGQMDVVPLTVSQLDGTSPIPPALQEILDRNWDSAATGGAGGLTQSDLSTILQRDPFATNVSPGTRATLLTNTQVSPTIPIYDPNIPTLDPVSGVCGQRYTFDPVLGQTFLYSPLSVSNGATPPGDIGQPITSSYSINSAITQNFTKTTTDTYTVGISAQIGAAKGSESTPANGQSGSASAIIRQQLKASDSLTFVNSWNPSTNNSTSTIQTLSIKSPLSSSGYAGPSQMQVWQDNLYGTYMFYPKPEDTTVNLQSSQALAQFGNAVTLTANVVPDPRISSVPTGTVTFYDGCTVLGGGAVPVVAGTATLPITWTAGTSEGGSHVIRALYSGDSNFFHNIGNTLTQTVTSGNTPYINANGISPSLGLIGTSVTLSGVNFGTTGTVTFNGIVATTSSWSPTSIVAVVPAGATTGPVTITTGNSSSNSIVFTVTQQTGSTTTTTLILSPTTSWTGYAAVASTQVTAENGVIPVGTVSCLSSPSTGATNSPAVVDRATGVAQVTIWDSPVLPAGSSSPLSYTETCTFKPTRGEPFISSQSNPISGTVVPVPAATVSAAAGLNIPRENHQATLLNDGTLLITGGDAGKYAGEAEDGPFVNFLQSAEIYNGSSFVSAAEMTTPRSLHQATLLSNGTGQVLITGGVNGTPLDSAELFTPGPVPGTPGSFTPTTLYDPAAQAFTTIATTMNTARYWHTATLLPSGKVLIVGGTSSIGNFNPSVSSYMVTAGSNGASGNALATAELYDPLTGKFTYTSGSMISARTRHIATLLTNGTVLIAGGMDNNGNAINTAEIYNPSTDTFTATSGNMTGGRIKAQGTRLGDGTVLITGGSVGLESGSDCPSFRAQNVCSRSDAEIYDPVSKTFTPTLGNMSIGRYSHTAVVLYDGSVLVSGGITTNGSTNNLATTEEIYRPSSGQFSTVTNLISPRYNQSATLLPSTGVLLVGGAAGSIFGATPLAFPPNTSPTTELYSPPAQGAGVHPKFMVLNVMYAPPGSGSTVTYTNSTQAGTSTTQTQTKSNALTISLGGTVNIGKIGASITANGGYTFAQNSTTTYGLNTTTADATTVQGPTSSSVGVDHEADVIWVWLNPESDFTLTNPGTSTTPGSAVWTGYATNQNDPNVASGEMDVVALTVGQLDGTYPIPEDLQQVLDRNWDPVSVGGAGGLTSADLTTILQRDPFAVNLTPGVPATAATNTPPNSTFPLTLYPVVDPNIPTHDVNNPDATQCGQRYEFQPNSGQTIQFATLGDTNQALSQTYSLQSNQTQSAGQTASDTYYVGLSVGVCFGLSGEDDCQDNPNQISASNPNGTSGVQDSNGKAEYASAYINLSIGDKYSWGHSWGSSTSGQTLVAQALTVKNPLPSDNYTGPVQMQVWKDNLFGTYMFYPKPTDTSVLLSTSESTTQTGDVVSFSATVAPDSTLTSSSHGAAIPTGTVTFYDGCNVIGTSQTLSNGIATMSTSWPASATGSHKIQAVYSGDGTFFHNDAPALTETVVGSGTNLPYILSGGVSPASGAVGTVVIISGQNFGNSGVVTFNGVAASTSSWNSGTITATVPVGATTGPIVVAVPAGATTNTYASNGAPFTVTLAPATTTTTLTLSPLVSWTGSPVTAHVAVTGPQGTAIEGTVSCGLTGAAAMPPVVINQTTASANVLLTGLPTVPSGSTATASYTASCTFVSANPNYSGSQSNVASGTVTNSPAATNAVTLGALNIARENQQANLLPDGTVLITGGYNLSTAISNSEIYSGGIFSVAAPMSVARTGHQATLLGNSTGKVLVTGGTDDNGNVFSSAELFTPGPVPGSPGSFSLTTLYDPSAGDSTSTVSSMNTARYLHTATLLNNGKVLIAGGLDISGTPLSSAELFDPITGNFSNTSGSLQNGRSGHNATLLSDGTVLISGGTGVSGALNTAEIYNPATDSFTFTHGSMTTARSGAQAVSVVAVANVGGVTAPSNLVLITGGQNSSSVLSSAELYNVATGTFSGTQDTNGPTTMATARYAHSATLLIDGTVLIAGGRGANGELSSEEIYNPNTGDFSSPASSMVTARSNHTATLLPDGSVLLAGGFNGGALANAEIFSTATNSGTLYPKFMVLDVLYAPPGSGSTMTYTDQTTVGTTTSTNNSFSSAQTASASVTVGVGVVSITPAFQWGHTFNQSGTSSYSFSTMTTNTTVVPGAVKAGTEGTKNLVSTGVDHEADIVQIWLNPATIYTSTSSSSNAPLIWNGFATNPNDPNVTVGGMDVISLTVGQLDGTSPIPSDLRDVLDRNWDPAGSGGAGGLLPTDFQTILQRDPFATNLSLNGAPAVTNSPTSYFDPNIPVTDPLAQGQCSTRYNFDPVLGQTFPFGQLGSTNLPLTQNYSLQNTASQVTSNTTTDQYSVANSVSLSIGLANILDLALAESNTFTWTNTGGNTKTNASAVGQALSIKNPVASDNYTGPTQMQVWVDKVYGTYMFYPKTSDTRVALTSSQASAGPGDSVILSATITADPRIAASANPPLAPTGVVNFYDGCTLLGSPQINSATGQASIAVSSLAVGSHSILAAYSGDSNFLHNISEPVALNWSSSAASVPYISQLSQSSGAVGTNITISGINFGSTGSVTFNGTVASTVSWSPSNIVATVPLAATSGLVVVTSAGTASDGVQFIVNQSSGVTSTSVTLSPATTWSGYPITADVIVAGAVNTIPSGSVSCKVASPTSPGTPTQPVSLDAAGSAKVSVTTLIGLPIVPAGGASIPFTVTCAFTGQTGFANSQSTAVAGTAVPAPASAQTAVGNLNTARENQQSSLLEDGTVLITGGDDGSSPLSTAEIYLGGVFTPAASMSTSRSGHQETVLSLSTGQVLITGGTDGSSLALASAELFTSGSTSGASGSFHPTTQYDPAAQIFTNNPTTMTTARYMHTATQLTTGEVLIAGGSDASGNALASAELFNPLTGSFTPTSGSMNVARIGQNATLLLDGTVLLSGGTNQDGTLTSAEIYNPVTNLFTVTHNATGVQTYMQVGRSGSRATRLGSGMVLITGGQYGSNTAELYNPATGAFSYTKDSGGNQTLMVASRSNHTATLLYDNTVLIAGGQDTTTDTLATQELYDAATGGFTSVGTNLQVPRHGQTATLLPTQGVLIAGGENTTTSGGTVEASAELFSPTILTAGIHPKYMVINIQYAPPGSGSSLTYTDTTTMGTSTGTENSFGVQGSVSTSIGVNLGIFSFKDTTTNTWTNTADSSSTYTTTTVTTDSQVVPGSSSSSLGVEHESDLIWVWLNPVANYTITSPDSIVWNGFGVDSNDTNVETGSMDILPLSVGQLDGTSPITQAEWDVLDRNWDSVSSGGAGPVTAADFKTILGRDPFATNLSGVGRATAPTVAPTGSQYVVFDPNVATVDPLNQNQCGNRYDFAPGFSMTFPYTQLGSTNQALTQNYSLGSTASQSTSSTTTDSYQVSISGNLNIAIKNLGNDFGAPGGGTDLADELQISSNLAKNAITGNLAASGQITWTNKWTATQNNSVLQSQALSIKNPLTSDNYTGPEQIQIWKDNLYGTFMFYPKPSDTSWALTSSEGTIGANNPVTLVATVTADAAVASAPTGTVTFYDGCTNLGTEPVSVATGTATITTTALSASGSHTIQAIYSGDSNFYHNNANSISVVVQ